MADEIFRQERKPISQSELQGHQENQFVPQGFDPTIPSNNGIQMTGPMPAGLLNAINAGNTPPEPISSAMKMPQKIVKKSKPRMVGSNKLEQLIQGAKELSHKYEKIQMPSMGKFYDGINGPVDGCVHIRPMTGEEEQILTTTRWVKKGNSMNMIFDSCIQEAGSNGFHSENFLTADRTYLLIWLRGISYGPEYNVTVTCPFTNKPFDHTIDLNFDVELCPADFSPQNLSDVLPSSGYKFNYKLATGKDEQEIVEYREKKSKFNNSNAADDSLLHRISLLVEDIEGLSDKAELLVLLQNLPVSDVSYLRNVTSEPPFGVNTKVTITSPFTMEDFEIDLPLESGFFFPRQKKE